MRKTNRALAKIFIVAELTKIAKHYDKNNDGKDNISMDAEMWWKSDSDKVIAYYRTFHNGSLEQDSHVVVLELNQKGDKFLPRSVIDLEDITKHKTDMVKYSKGFKYLEASFNIEHEE